MQQLTPLEPGCTYHIYNRGINGTTLFSEPHHYRLFLEQYAYYTEPGIDTYAYCLLNNHFHLVIRVKEESELDLNRWKAERGWSKVSDASTLLGHCFNSYCQQYNKLTNRTGSLFEKPFHREWVDEDGYLSQLIYYVHANPKKHQFTTDFRTYPYSSYRSILSEKPTLLRRQYIVDWFGGRQRFIDFHTGMEAASELPASGDEHVWKG
jgi:hypothetical protein